MQPQQYPQPFQAPQYPPPQAFQPQPYQPVYPQYPTTPAGYPVAQPMQYGQPAAAPVAPVITGTLDDFFAQAATGSKAWVFMGKPNGTTYQGVIERPITNADIRQQTDNKGVPSFNRDGSPKWVMVVPMLVQPTPEHQDGKATWWVKGQARDELVRAMAAAGVDVSVQRTPEPGAVISVTKTGERPVPGQNPAYIYAVQYQRPAAGAPAPQPAPTPPVTNPAYPPMANPAQPAQQPQPMPGVFAQAGYGGYAAPGQPPAQAQPMASYAYPGPQSQIMMGGGAGQPAQFAQVQPYPGVATAPAAPQGYGAPVGHPMQAPAQFAAQAQPQPAGGALPHQPNQLNPGQNALLAELTGGAGQPAAQ